MRKIIFLVFLINLFYGQYYITLCSENVSAQCKELPIFNQSNKVSSASFTCQKQITQGGWFFCPSCIKDYLFVRCESSWLFGLYKTSFCAKNYSVNCGEYCDLRDNVLSRSLCILTKTEKCCKIPTNEIKILSPSNNASFYKNEPVNFSIKYSGMVANISIEYGDGANETKAGNINELTLFSHSYSSLGEFQVTATAYTCNNCTHIFNSSSSIKIRVENRR